MERTKLDNVTRCMGNLRPVSFFNIWKKQEFKDRLNFNMEVMLNSKFIEDFKF